MIKTMKVRVSNIGEACAYLEMEMTQEQYTFLKDVAQKLNTNGEAYASLLYVEPIKEK